MKLAALVLFIVIAPIVRAATPIPEPMEGTDPSYFAIDPGDLVLVKDYVSDSQAYQIITVDDPTIEKIYVSPESLAKAVRIINLDALKRNPVAIVGHEFVTDASLVTLWDFELDKRKAEFKKSPGAAPLSH